MRYICLTGMKSQKKYALDNGLGRGLLFARVLANGVASEGNSIRA
jgi:hypothetical protein